jgi:hypothetical protein
MSQVNYIVSISHVTTRFIICSNIFFLKKKTYNNHEPDLSPQGDRNTCHTSISQRIMRFTSITSESHIT